MASRSRTRFSSGVGDFSGIDETLRGPRTMPLARDWIVQWSKFFEVPGETVDGPLVRSLTDLAATLGLTIRRPADLPELDDMGGLVRFVARTHGVGVACAASS